MKLWIVIILKDKLECLFNSLKALNDKLSNATIPITFETKYFPNN